MGPTTTSDPRRTVSTTGGVENGGLSSSSSPPGHDSQVDYKLRVAQEVCVSLWSLLNETADDSVD